MNRVSKGLFVSSVGIGFGIATLLVILATVLMKTVSPHAGLILIAMSWIPMMYAACFMLVIWYKSWEAIQDGHARTTPGKAIGFLFIPIFDFYWIFQAVWGLAKDFNAYLERNSIPGPRLPEGLFLAYCILCFTTWIPVLGLVLLVVNCIIVVIIVSALCDAINAAIGKRQIEVAR